jgi:hypothetical protein
MALRCQTQCPESGQLLGVNRMWVDVAENLVYDHTVCARFPSALTSLATTPSTSHHGEER